MVGASNIIMRFLGRAISIPSERYANKTRTRTPKNIILSVVIVLAGGDSSKRYEANSVY